MEWLRNSIDQTYPPKPVWSVDQIPDLSGKVVIVTGGNTGIGKESVRALLVHNATVYMASRSEERAQSAIAELKEATGKEPIFLRLDLGNLSNIRKAAEEFLSKEKQLHVLMNNAGVMYPPIDQVTDDGYDMQFGTNVIGHFHFTQLLMPALLSAAQSSPDKHARIVTVSSWGHEFWPGLEYDTFSDGPARRKCSTQYLYSQSKYGNVVVARELARRYGDQGIVSISLHPGSINSELARHSPGFSFWGKLLGYDTAHGALTQLYAATAPEAANLNGQYLKPWARLGKAVPSTQDPEVAAKLWAWLEAAVAGK
ncbi:hypothetical protein CCMSSC00406_0009835 [Pleurotus cornucopiae]|uniref:Uncharacterized protein n=1 Tax=Pleurotus cornucopiae TaxID=5321 RepID=A0ACB7IUT7_PLECO|nr:hypothetical protein CCMSSC00406_0009835 [Pleurotus cornucopiae]